MTPLKFAVLGTGFWSYYQIPAWFEVGGVELAAVYNRTVSKAEKVAARFNVPRVYGDVEELLKNEKLDFVDIITEIDAHAPFVKLAAQYKLPVICQKPMAPDLATAEEMVSTCQKAGVPLFIHENWRWQTPIRAIQQVLAEGSIGTPFRARLNMISGFPVFANQPFLKTLKQFILTDLGSHILDTARFLFGEANSLYCQTRKVHASIVPCNADLLKALKGEGRAETTGEDNLKTVRLVFASYDSAEHGQAIHFKNNQEL